MPDLNEQLQKIVDLSREIKERLAENRSRLTSNQKAWAEAAKEFANYQVKRAAVQIFVRKYNASGVETLTGRLLDAISNPVVWLKEEGKKGVGKVYFAWPAKLPGSKNSKKRNEKSVYVYGSAVNYGAVRRPKTTRIIKDRINPNFDKTKTLPIFGARLARSLKRKAYGGKAKQRVEQYVERQKRLDRKGISQFAIQTNRSTYKSASGKKRSTISWKIKSAGVVITRAFNFFTLSSQEQKFLSGLWNLSFNRKYGQLSKIRIAA